MAEYLRTAGPGRVARTGGSGGAGEIRTNPRVAEARAVDSRRRPAGSGIAEAPTPGSGVDRPVAQCVCPAHRLRESGEPAAGENVRTAARNRRSPIARRVTRAAHVPADRREPAARRRRSGRGHRARGAARSASRRHALLARIERQPFRRSVRSGPGRVLRTHGGRRAVDRLAAGDRSYEGKPARWPPGYAASRPARGMAGPRVGGRASGRVPRARLRGRALRAIAAQSSDDRPGPRSGAGRRPDDRPGPQRILDGTESRILRRVAAARAARAGRVLGGPCERHGDVRSDVRR